MSTHNVRLGIAVAAVLIPGSTWPQHDAHQPASPQTLSAELTQCLRVQPVIENIITVATARAEAARLSNSPSELRAAVDHLEAAIRDIRAQSAPCSMAAAAVDPHAGHTMPGAAPATKAAPSNAKPEGAKTADPHAGAAQAGDLDAAGIEAWLRGYDAAFNAKDMDKLATFYHPDVTIYEGGGVNNGWADYRDRHLGPELKAFENLQFGHSNTKVTVLSGGQSAYATSEYSIKAKMGEQEIDSRGLETLVLRKGADGSWKIRHSHTSSRPARRPAA
jgi:ketosteroid isomerase-like protein